MTTDADKTNARKRWIEAAKAFAIQPGAEVSCPACDEGQLSVRDSEPVAGKIERVLTCGQCSARVFIRMDA